LSAFVGKLAATSMRLVQVAFAIKAGTDAFWPITISGLLIVMVVARVVSGVVTIIIRVVAREVLIVVRAMAREVNGVVSIVIVGGMAVFRVVRGHRLLASWFITAWAGFKRVGTITVYSVRYQWPELLRPESVLVLILGRAGGINKAARMQSSTRGSSGIEKLCCAQGRHRAALVEVGTGAEDALSHATMHYFTSWEPSIAFQQVLLNRSMWVAHCT